MEPMAELGILIFKHIIFKVMGSRAGDCNGAKNLGKNEVQQNRCFWVSFLGGHVSYFER
jgi:hypothetical protein|tara:strand:+ start:855 stop:1031 length:177 start_codon:yes stop_codon:yes gene_type:complete